MVKRSHGSFRMRIFWALLLISAVPMLAVGGWFSYQTRVESGQTVQEGSELYVEQVAGRLDELTEAIDNITQTVFSDKQLQEALRNKELSEVARQSVVDQFLLNVDMSSGAARDVILVTDERAYSRRKTAVESAEYLRYGQSWYADAVMANGGLVVSSRRDGAYQKGRPRVASMSRAILDISDLYKGRLGFLVLEIDPDYIAEICGDVNAQEGSRVVICDRYGYVLYSSEPMRTDTLPLDTASYAASAGNGTVEMDGLRYRMNYVTSKKTQWKVLRFVPEKYVDSLGKEVLWTNFAVGLLCAMAAALISALLSATLTRPIYQLRALVRRIGAGELGATETFSGDDVVEELGNSINEMSRNLKEMVYTNYKMKLRTKEAELRSLQNQINPHFLYNTLASIQLLAVTKKEPEIARMVEELGAFFHLTISEGGETVPLSQELKLVDIYISLQKVRFGERICYRCEVPEELRSLLVPKLILQPLVENAIIHGLEERIEPGTVTLSARRKQDRVEIVISDDGVGMDEEELTLCRRGLHGEKGTRSDGKVSVGMHNVEERLRLCSGGELGLSIESEKGKGTSVYLSLPLEGITDKKEDRQTVEEKEDLE